MVYLNKPMLVVKIGINADIYLSHSGSWNSVTQYSAVLCMILCSKYNFFFIHRHFQRVSAAQCFTAGNVHVSTHYWKNVQNAKDILRFQYHACIYANTHTPWKACAQHHLQLFLSKNRAAVGCDMLMGKSR